MVHLRDISLLRSKKSRAELWEIHKLSYTPKWKGQRVLFLVLILADLILQQTNPLRLSSTFLLHRLLSGQKAKGTETSGLPSLPLLIACCPQPSNNSSQQKSRGQLSIEDHGCPCRGADSLF